MTRHLVAFFAGMALGVFAPQAMAACAITTTPGTNFGDYDVLSPSSTTLSSSFGIRCSPASLWAVVEIDDSANTGGQSNRAMKRVGGSELLTYNLYKNASMTNVWGMGGSGQWLVGSITTRTLTVYGSIPAGQNVPVGTYTDTVVLRISP